MLKITNPIYTGSKAYPYVMGDGSVEFTLEWNKGLHTRAESIPVTIEKGRIIIRNGEGIGDRQEITLKGLTASKVEEQIDLGIERAFRRPVGTEDRYD